MTVQLAIGMTAIRRDGARMGPVSEGPRPDAPFCVGCVYYNQNGRCYDDGDCPYDLVAAGYPWATLGAQVGDTVKRVWNGTTKSVDEWDFRVLSVRRKAHPDSLYVIVKPAAKPADRPRAAHKLDLQEGDVVELMGWQHGGDLWVGKKFTVVSGKLISGCDAIEAGIPSPFPKGHRPLFRVISLAAEQVRGDYSRRDGKWGKHRAADAKPDEVIKVLGWQETPRQWILGHMSCSTDTHRFTLTFPHGSDTGTVIKENL